MKAGRLLIISIALFAGLVCIVSGQAKSPKRGICGDASPQDLAALAPSVTWYYDWGVEPPAVSQGHLICSDKIQILTEGTGDILFSLNHQMRPGIYILTVRGKDIIKHTKLIIK